MCIDSNIKNNNSYKIIIFSAHIVSTSFWKPQCGSCISPIPLPFVLFYFFPYHHLLDPPLPETGFKQKK